MCRALAHEINSTRTLKGRFCRFEPNVLRVRQWPGTTGYHASTAKYHAGTRLGRSGTNNFFVRAGR